MRRQGTARYVRPFTLLTIFLVSWGLTTHGKYSATGDEPHYLMIAQSLRADGDLNLANNYAQHDGVLFGAAGLEPETHARPGRGGILRPVHDIGLAVALLPAYGLATVFEFVPPEHVLQRFRMTRGLFAYSLLSLVIIGIVAAAAGATMSALESSGLARSSAALVVLVAWLAPPVLSNSFLIFPEPFALLVTAWAMLEWTTASRPWGRRDQAFVAALGLLVWVHRKFAPFVLAILVVIWWRRFRLGTAPTGGSRVAVALLFALPQVALVIWTLYYWGNVAGPMALDGLPFTSDRLISGLPGLLVDRENGLIWWAPVYALVPLGWWLHGRDLDAWALPIAALIIPAVAHQWWAGFSPAGRFIVPLVPILCFAGAGLLKARPASVAAAVLLVPQLLISAYAWQHPRFLWPQGDGENRVLTALAGGLGGAQSWIPSFRTAAAPPWSSALLILTAVLVVNLLLAIACRKPSRG